MLIIARDALAATTATVPASGCLADGAGVSAEIDYGLVVDSLAHLARV